MVSACTNLWLPPAAVRIYVDWRRHVTSDSYRCLYVYTRVDRGLYRMSLIIDARDDIGLEAFPNHFPPENLPLASAVYSFCGGEALFTAMAWSLVPSQSGRGGESIRSVLHQFSTWL